MEIDERMETLCNEFSALGEPEKDYILGVSQTLAHSVKSAMPLPIAGIERAAPEYTGLIKENLA